VSVLAVKLRRDLRAEWPRLALMTIAITVSLVVFGGVLTAWTGIKRETVAAYANTGPASATVVFSDDVDSGRLAQIAAEARTRPGILDAAARSQFTSEVRVDGRLREAPLQVFVAPATDPMTMANFRVDDGEWPPAAGDILVRADALTLLDVAVGDRISIVGPAGEPLSLRVSGTVYDPSLAPSPQQQTGAGYLSLDALAAAGGQPELDQLKVQFGTPGSSEPTRDRAAAVAAATGLGTWLQRDQGLAIREIQVPTPYRHPHQFQAEALLLSLLAGAAAALLLSTILVATMLNGLFTRQIPQIGILKAIGARSGRIGRQCLMMTLLVAATATALSAGPVIWLGRVGIEALLGFLGIEAGSLASPWWAYAAVVFVGLLLPPLMALVPLVRVSRTTVRAAIDHHGGGQVSAATGVVARASRVTWLNRGLLMALRNTLRRPARFVLSVTLLGFAGMVFVAGMSLHSATAAIDEQRKAQRTWDVEVALGEPAAADRLTSLVRAVPGVARAEGWDQVQTGVAGQGQIPVTRTYPDQGHGSVSVTGVPTASTLLPRPKILEGRWPAGGETGAVVLNQVTVSNTVPDVQPGDTVQLVLNGRSTSWKVVGLVEEREGGSGGAYVTAEGLSAALGQPMQARRLRIVTDGHDEQTRTRVATAVNQALSGAGVDVLTSASVSRSDTVSAGHLGPVLLILIGVAVPLGVIGIIGLASTMSAGVLDRTREFAVLHAIGARPAVVRRIVAAEAVFLAVTSCIFAAVPTLGLTALLGTGLGNLFMSAPLPLRISGAATGIWITLVVLGAVLATHAAAGRASRLTVREALAHV
jgi:putative ABC transport system permease protein